MIDQHQAMIELCRAVRSLRDGTTPRNRFGKLEPDAATYEQFRKLAVLTKIEHGGRDILDQAAMIASRILTSPDGFPEENTQ